MSHHLYAVEFVHGPFDGHKLVVTVEPEEALADSVALPVNENVFRAMEGREQAPHAPVTSVAIYLLDKSPGSYPCRYYFIGASAPEKMTADG